ncbi:hypothetical protein ACJQWK_08858 [Exserohilum turcicum]
MVLLSCVVLVRIYGSLLSHIYMVHAKKKDSEGISQPIVHTTLYINIVVRTMPAEIQQRAKKYRHSHTQQKFSLPQRQPKRYEWVLPRLERGASRKLCSGFTLSENHTTRP